MEGPQTLVPKRTVTLLHYSASTEPHQSAIAMYSSSPPPFNPFKFVIVVLLNQLAIAINPKVNRHCHRHLLPPIVVSTDLLERPLLPSSMPNSVLFYQHDLTALSVWRLLFRVAIVVVLVFILVFNHCLVSTDLLKQTLLPSSMTNSALVHQPT